MFPNYNDTPQGKILSHLAKIFLESVHSNDFETAIFIGEMVANQTGCHFWQGNLAGAKVAAKVLEKPGVGI